MRNSNNQGTAGPGGGVALRVRALRHTYRSGSKSTPVLHGIDLDVPEGGYLALTGPSGAGKSTLLSLIGGLEPPQEGHIQVGEHDLRGLSGDALAAYRRATVGFVFQHYGLVDVLTARENLELALALSGIRPEQRRRRANGLLGEVGLGDRSDHRPAALSGGERQRVAIARALANRPRLLVADEPTGNLDSHATDQVLALLERAREEAGCTLLIVSHNPTVAARAEEIRRLDRGRWAA